MRRAPLLALLLATALGWGAEVASDGLLPGDQVRIEVYNHPDLTATIRIPADGPVHIPLLGPVDGARGMTVDAFADRLRTLYEADYLRQAVVVATVSAYARRSVFVLGSVARPGAIDFDPENPLTASRAVTAAGGLQDEADRQGILVLRDGDPASPMVASLGGRDGAGSDLRLRPNDLVVVPRLDRVYITGQVAKPGALAIPADGGLTVSKAVSLAGGFDRYARQSEVQVLRAGQSVRTVDVAAILAGKAGLADPPLAPGDTVFVPQRGF